MKKQIFSAVASLAVVAAMSVSAFAVDAGSTNGSGTGTAQLAPDKAVSVIPAGVQGVQIDAAAGVFGTEGELVIEVDVEPVAEAKAAEVAETIEEAIDIDVVSVNTVIDISAFIGDLEVQPNGEVKITVAWDGVSNQVIYVGDNGEVEVMPTEQTGNVIAFTTTHFSDFYMVTVAEDSGNGDTSGSGSDDKNQPTGVVLAVIPAIAAASAIVVSKKRK